MRACFVIWIFFIGLIFANNEKQQVDKSRFTQLLSNHLLFDHYDKAFNQLSRKISQQFREALQIRLRHLSENKAHAPVDVQILKRQLRGAVGCKFCFYSHHLVLPTFLFLLTLICFVIKSFC
jgi:hypothetical protein